MAVDVPETMRRPSKEAAPRTIRWAQISWEDPDHRLAGTTLTSPPHLTDERDVDRWVSAHLRDHPGEPQVFVWGRDVRTGKDSPVLARGDENFRPEPRRLQELLSIARSQLDEGRRRSMARLGIRRADYSSTTEVTETEAERGRVQRIAADTRERAEKLDRKLHGGADPVPMLRYEDVYESSAAGDDRPKPEYRDEIVSREVSR